MKTEPTTPEASQDRTRPDTMADMLQPDKDPTLMRKQQLQQQYQQVTGKIMELRQKRQLVDDMITDATIQAAELRGALKEIDVQQGRAG